MTGLGDVGAWKWPKKDLVWLQINCTTAISFHNCIKIVQLHFICKIVRRHNTKIVQLQFQFTTAKKCRPAKNAQLQKNCTTAKHIFILQYQGMGHLWDILCRIFLDLLFSVVFSHPDHANTIQMMGTFKILLQKFGCHYFVMCGFHTDSLNWCL